MSILEMLLIVAALVSGIRVGMWLATKESNAQAEIQSIHARIDAAQDETSRRIDDETRSINMRIDIVQETLEGRLNAAEDEINDLKEQEV